MCCLMGRYKLISNAQTETGCCNDTLQGCYVCSVINCYNGISVACSFRHFSWWLMILWMRL